MEGQKGGHKGYNIFILYMSSSVAISLLFLQESEFHCHDEVFLHFKIVMKKLTLVCEGRKR